VPDESAANRREPKQQRNGPDRANASTTCYSGVTISLLLSTTKVTEGTKFVVRMLVHHFCDRLSDAGRNWLQIEATKSGDCADSVPAPQPGGIRMVVARKIPEARKFVQGLPSFLDRLSDAGRSGLQLEATESGDCADSVPALHNLAECYHAARIRMALTWRRLRRQLPI
jgi:hypothetical protein